MTEILTGKQVLALLSKDEVPEIEYLRDGKWFGFKAVSWGVYALCTTETKFRIKPTPQRRLSVTLANGEVVSWPEPVRVELPRGTRFWYVCWWGTIDSSTWDGDKPDKLYLAFGNIHLTRGAAQEHADALRKINTQGATCA